MPSSRIRRPYAVLLCAAVLACGDSTGPPEDVFRAESIVSGNSFSCVLDQDGAAHCWGANTSGQLGRDMTSNAERLGPVAGGLTFEAIAAGDFNVCGLSSGNVYCWGRGELLGSTQPLLTPTPVPPFTETFAAISVGGRHACAVRSDGSAACWGHNDLLGGGQLGDGTTTFQAGATDVAGSHAFDEVSAGFVHTCGRTGPEVWCWGSNYDNALGVVGPASALTPQLMSLGHPARRVRVGAGFTCIESDTSIHCWGTNRSGQLGDASADATHSTATTIASSSVLSGVGMSAVNRIWTHACALDDAGRAYCWGANDFGQLGRDVINTCPPDLANPIPCDRTPGTVETNLTFDEIAPGALHTCGISNGDIYCWGTGEHGELGNGPGSDSTVPVQVAPPA